MKLNTGILAHMLPAPPAAVCGRPDHGLVLSDVRFLLPGQSFFEEDMLYFTTWEDLKAAASPLPPYIFCDGGGDEAAEFLAGRKLTGIVSGGENPLIAFSIIQSIFLRFSRLETSLLNLLRCRAPLCDILNCCAEFFENHAVLYDADRRLIGSSSLYLPGPEDIYWKETAETGRRSEKMLADARQAGQYPHAIRTPSSDFMVLGPGLPTIMTYSYFESGKRLAALVIAQTNKPLSVCQLKLLDHVAELIAPGIGRFFTGPPGLLDSLRNVLAAYLNREIVDPLVAERCLALSGWKAEDDYVLLVIDIEGGAKNPDVLARSRHIYERLYPDCVAFVHSDRLVLVVHNDTGEVMADSLPRLQKQLEQQNAACGFSLPFSGIHQAGAQYVNAGIALRYGEKSGRIRLLRDAAAEYLVGRIAAHIPLFPLCHREVVRIYDYDAKNGTSLLPTLEAYLRHNKSLKTAAESLFIHRSTMTYRLGSIEKIARLNLDDPSERLHILLSCIILMSFGRSGKKEPDA